MDEFGFVQAVDGFGQSVVIAVALAADGWRNARFIESFRVPDGQVCEPRSE